MADEVLDPIDQTADVDQSFDEQSADQADSADGNQEQQQPEEEKIDGRKFNPEWSKQLKELREAYANDPERGPKVADMLTKLRDTYARYQTIQEMVPKGVEEIRALQSLSQSLGGQEKAAEMLQRVADVEQIDARIEAGDFAVVSELPESMQKGIYQMLPDMLTDLQEKDHDAYAAAVTPHFQSALLGTEMGDHLKKMYAAAGDNEPLKALIKDQYDWFQEQTSGAGKMPSGQKQVNHEVQRLQGELSKRQEADDAAFVSGIADTTNKYVDETFAKNAEVYLKQLGLSDAQKTDLMDSFATKLTMKLQADSAFQKQLGAYKSLKNRSAETVNGYIRSKIDENAKTILDGLVTARYGGMKVKKAAVAEPQVATNGGAVRVAQAPPIEEWDRDKMEAYGHAETVKKGRFFLKGGREVQLARPN